NGESVAITKSSPKTTSKARIAPEVLVAAGRDHRRGIRSRSRIDGARYEPAQPDDCGRGREALVGQPVSVRPQDLAALRPHSGGREVDSDFAIGRWDRRGRTVRQSAITANGRSGGRDVYTALDGVRRL